MDITLLRVILPAVLAFLIGIAITPVVTHFLYRYRVWKKVGGKHALGGRVAEEFNRLKGEGETKTPRMGGVVIWGSVLLTLAFLYLTSLLLPESLLGSLHFLSRAQTWIPLAVMLFGALIGFLNDFYDVTHRHTGIPLSVRLALITVIAGFIGWWFYDKLEVVSVSLLWFQPIVLDFLLVPFFVLVALALYASGVIDGIDGLSGGVFAASFGAYTGIALINGQYDLAAFCATVVGAILAFLWFNVPPARFWMTETGSMALTLTLAVVIFMTDRLADGHGLSVFLVVGIPLIATVGSNVLQIAYRKLRGRKLFRVAPLHHHFEAIGWSSEKVTMRYWIISIVCAVLGVLLAQLL